MRIYKKWFVVDVSKEENPKCIFAFVSKNLSPIGKNPFYIINGIKYNVAGKSSWRFDEGEKNRATQYEVALNNKLINLNGLELALEENSIKEAIDTNGYWKYRDVFVVLQGIDLEKAKESIQKITF